MKRVLLLLLIISIQSCKVYHKSPVSLEQAYLQQAKVRIENKDDTVKKYTKIAKDNNEYYGISNDLDNTKTMLKETDIKNVRLYDKSGSTVNTILATIGGALVGLAIIIATAF